jgi:CRISPR-associated protein Csm4
LRLFEITIKPLGPIGTSLKGDTLFGHFCWQAAHDPVLVDGGLERQLSIYKHRPFLVVSSAFPKFIEGSRTIYALKRPELPHSVFDTTKNQDRWKRINNTREIKKRRWILLEQGIGSIDISKAALLSDEDLLAYVEKQATAETIRLMKKVEKRYFSIASDQPHNTIHRITQTTGTAPFTPYTQEVIHYYPETELAVFVLLDDAATDIERVGTGFERIGQYGYGKDASIGMGRFKLGEIEELDLPNKDLVEACYTLAPCVPDKNAYSKILYKPFIRYGKHGDALGNSRYPFKNPVIMADEGAVLFPVQKNSLMGPYVGTCVTGVSNIMPNTVVQGYAPFIPMKMEGINE